MKTCPKCKTTKPLSDFNKNKNRKDGYNGYCRKCHNAASNESGRKTGRVKGVVRTRQSKEERARKNHEYYLANKNRILERNAQYQSNNLDKHRQREGNRRALKYSTNSMPDNWWEILLEFYGASCMNPKCPYELDDWNVLSHDHIIAITKNGEHSLENSQILCRRCNSRKSNKHIDFRNGKICSMIQLNNHVER